MSLEINITFAKVLKKTKPVELTTGFEETKNSWQNSILNNTFSIINIALQGFLVQQQKYWRRMSYRIFFHTQEFLLYLRKEFTNSYLLLSYFQDTAKAYPTLYGKYKIESYIHHYKDAGLNSFRQFDNAISYLEFCECLNVLYTNSKPSAKKNIQTKVQLYSPCSVEVIND